MEFKTGIRQTLVTALNRTLKSGCHKPQDFKDQVADINIQRDCSVILSNRDSRFKQELREIQSLLNEEDFCYQSLQILEKLQHSRLRMPLLTLCYSYNILVLILTLFVVSFVGMLVWLAFADFEKMGDLAKDRLLSVALWACIASAGLPSFLLVVSFGINWMVFSILGNLIEKRTDMISEALEQFESDRVQKGKLEIRVSRNGGYLYSSDRVSEPRVQHIEDKKSLRSEENDAEVWGLTMANKRKKTELGILESDKQ